MEVHHHTHTSRKKWTHYFWEFLMLFLAVFCGFIAENQREHFIEHKRERQYMKSMTTDLKSDTSQLNYLITRNKYRLSIYDSMMTLLKSEKLQDSIRSLCYYYGETGYYLLFQPGRRTIDQLENSGGVRLIRDQKVADSVADYYYYAAFLVDHGKVWMGSFNAYHDEAIRIFDYSDFDKFKGDRNAILASIAKIDLMTYEPVQLKIFYNKLSVMKDILVGHTNALSDLNLKAARTLQLLQEEYHLK